MSKKMTRDDFATIKLGSFFIRHLIGHVPFKWILKGLVKPIGKKIRVELLMERYIGENDAKFNIMDHAYYFSLKAGIKIGALIKKINEENIKASLKVGNYRTLSARALVLISESIDECGFSKKILRLKAPGAVVWEITRKCNLQCAHCSSAAEKIGDIELNTEEAKSLIDQLSEAGVCWLLFSGGEPLLRKDFFELAQYTVEKGLTISLASNGTLITKEIAKRLKKIGFHSIQISVDGATKETHESFRGTSGCFAKAVEGVKNCITAGLEVSVAPTITSINYGELEEIIFMAERLGATGVNVFDFIPTGQGKVFQDLCDIGFEKRGEMLEKIAKIKREMVGKMRISLATTMNSFRVLIEIEEKWFVKALESFGGCAAGRVYCAISANGEVKPCVFLPVIAGSLRSHSFNAIWREAIVFKELRNRELLRGFCSRCDLKFACGGCRSMAYAYSGDYLESDPSCPYTGEISNARRKKAIKRSKKSSMSV